MTLHKFSISCIFVILKWVHLVTSDSCFDVFSVVQDGMYMEHHTYSKVITYSPYACAAQCLMSSVCLSFSYNTEKDICHLNDNATVTDLVSIDGFIYSNISLWPQSLSGPCAVTSCPGSSRCQVDRLHRASCVPEFQGCGVPPEVTGSHRQYEGHFRDAVVTYTCNEDFMECGDKTTSLCQSTGQWEDVTGLCGQFRWHNPVTGTKHYIPCGPTGKFKVTIVGTPTQAVRNSLDFVSGTNTLFHVDFRFDSGNTINKTVINTKLSGAWKSQIKLSIMPLTVGQEFNIEVSLQGGIYTLIVDDAIITTFTERLPGHNPEYVAMYNHVTLKLLQFSI